MPYQTGKNLYVAIAREIQATPGTAAVVGATAWMMRCMASPGMKMTRGQINSQESTQSGIRPMGRLGGKSTAGSFNVEGTVGGATDMLLESIMRGTWAVAAALTTATGAGACVDLTANATNQITRTGSGSFVTDGWKVGDVATLAAYSTAADNGLLLRVVTVAATVLTFAGTPLTIGAADTACSLTRAKKVINPAAPNRWSHSVEQYNQDADVSELFLGSRLTGMKLSAKPNSPLQITFTFMGLDRQLLTTGTSPYFTTPTLTTGIEVVADDSLLFYEGAPAAGISGFDLDFTINAKGEPLVGQLVGPDVYDNDLTVSGSMTALFNDFTDFTKWDAETEFEMSSLFSEPNTAPVNFLSMFIPRVKIADINKNLFSDGALTLTKQLMIGPKPSGVAGYDYGVATFSSSAA